MYVHVRFGGSQAAQESVSIPVQPETSQNVQAARKNKRRKISGGGNKRRNQIREGEIFEGPAAYFRERPVGETTGKPTGISSL